MSADAVPEAREVLQAAGVRQGPARVEIIQLAFCLVVAERLIKRQDGVAQ